MIAVYDMSISHSSYFTDIEIKGAVITVWHSLEETSVALGPKATFPKLHLAEIFH